MGKTIDVQAVSIFVRVAEAASFRGAASTLGMQPSTVSRRVAELETQLGARLLKRTTRKVSLTDAGAAYLRACQPALGALEDATLAITKTAIEARGRLRVTAAVTFGERFLGPLIAAYLRAHPHVELDVVLTDRHVDIVQEGIDVAFRAGPIGDESLVARELGRATVCCYASPAYLGSRSPPREPADLEDHDCVVYPPLAPGGRWTFRVKERTVHVSVRGRLVVNSIRLSIDAAIRGLGVVRLPTPSAMEAARSGELVELLERYSPPESRFHIVHPSGAHTPARVRAFIDLAMKMIELAP